MSEIIGLLLTIIVFLIYLLLRHYLPKILFQVKTINIQLDSQNPICNKEALVELRKNMDFWYEQMHKYKDDLSDKNKEISDLSFNIYWQYRDIFDNYKIKIAEAQESGNPLKVLEKHEKEDKKTEEKIREMEKKAMELDAHIKETISKRDLENEFLGYWKSGEIE